MDFLEQQIAIHDLTSKAFSNLKGVTKGFFKMAKRRKLIDLSIEGVLNDMDLSDRDFRKVIKEDYEEVFSEEEFRCEEFRDFAYLCHRVACW